MKILRNLKIFKIKNLTIKSWRSSNVILLSKEARDEGSSVCFDSEEMNRKKNLKMWFNHRGRKEGEGMRLI